MCFYGAVTPFLKSIEPVIQFCGFSIAVALTVAALLIGWKTRIMSIAGIAIYACSWPAMTEWGMTMGSIVFMAGFLLWLTSTYYVITETVPARQRQNAAVA